MTLLVLPAAFRPESFILQQYTSQRSFASPRGGSEQVIDDMNDRWMATVTLPKGSPEDVAAREAFVNALRGMTNTVALYHFARKQPFGNMRGTPTAQAALAGAALIAINTTAGATLRAGDMVGLSGLLLQTAQDAIANGAGVLTLPIVNRLRRDIAAGTPVVWDRPTAPFRLVSKPGFAHFYGYGEGVSMDFVEAIE